MVSVVSVVVVVCSWLIYLDDDSSYFTCQRRSKSLKDLDVKKFVVKSSDHNIVASCSTCPICLEEYDTGDEVSTSRKLCTILLVLIVLSSLT